jgi:amino acid transporter
VRDGPVRSRPNFELILATQVTWCWILGTVMCFALAASIAEIVSAYPTSGGLYTASAQLVPRKHRALVGWMVGWLNMLGR